MKPAEPTDAQLLERVMRSIRFVRGSYPGANDPRWLLVSRLFALGSTSASELCRRFGLDPDEPIKQGWSEGTARRYTADGVEVTLGSTPLV